MIDTLHIWISSERVGQIDRDLFTQNLVAMEEIKSDFDEIKIRGRLKNLNIMLTPTGLSIKGSLPKFYQGNNLKNLNLPEIKFALQKIGDDLSIPIFKGKLTRIDIGYNISMNYEPMFYFNGLGELSKMHRGAISKTSLYYKNSSKTKTLNFYDKNQEFYKTNRIPKSFQIDKNLLRYELRLENRLSRNFNNREILVSDLIDPNFCRDLVTIWSNNYFTIKKNNLVCFNPILISSPKDYVDYLTFIGIDEIREKIPIDIQFLKSINAFNSKENYSRLIAKLNNLKSNVKISRESELNKELDSKIKRILIEWEVNYHPD